MSPTGETSTPHRLQQALALHQQGQLLEALALYESILQQTPNHAETLNLWGTALYQLKRYDQARQALTRAIELAPQLASAHTHLSLVCQALGLTHEALAHAQQAVALAPQLPQAHNNLGILWHELQDYPQAIACYEQALSLDPAYAQAHFNLANALHDRHQWAAALPHYQRACEIVPRYTQAWFNWGNTLSKLGQYESSLNCYEHVLQIDPQHVQALNNLGNALRELTHYAQAQPCYELATQIDPHYHEARLNLAYLLLLTGQWSRAWPLYETRWQLDKTGLIARAWPYPLWDGISSLQGKRIVLHAEQGLGDTLQFVRYALVLQQQGAHVCLMVQSPLVSLMRRLPGIESVLSIEQTPPVADWHCPLLSLPLALALEHPTSVLSPYLSADPIRTQAWQARWRETSHMTVGLVFSGSRTHLHDHYRSVPLTQLLAQLPTHHQGQAIQYVSLQKEYRSGDQALLAAHGILDLSESLKDFDDTAALCASMDHIISVDTSVAHLAGALARPLSLLLPLVPDWRWGVTGQRSEWYPSARLYRQTVKGDWWGPLAQLQDDWR